MSKRLLPQARLLVLALAGILMMGVLSGCYVYGRGDDGAVEVGLAPPVLRAEVAIATPGPGYLWVPGYWDWRGREWGWVEGTWVRPPHAHAVWVAPRYERHRDRWRYHHGHWR
jgi:hypothetical protein